MKWKQQLDGMQAYKPGKPIEEVQREYGLKEVIKLASNENPFGCSPKVTAYLQNNAVNHALYPDGYAQNLRTAVADHLGVKETQLLFGNGSDDIIAIITRALLYPGVNTIMADPSFSQYWHNAEIEGAEVRKIPCVEGAHDLDSMAAAIDDQTSIVWVCSPNNPTGVVIPDTALRAFLAKVPSDVLVVLDEAYIEYVTHPGHKDTLPIIDEYPNVLLLRTFSKAYGLASFRVGYAIGQAGVIAKLDPVRAPFNNTILSQAVAAIALSDQAYIEACREANENGKKQYVEFCEKHNLKYFPSDTNFIFFDTQADSDVVFQELMKRGFIVRSGNALGLQGFIRVTIGTEAQNAALLSQLDEVLTQQGVFA
ncbi:MULTISPECIES: histidinol-phosphate transaminase [Lysinibacillus]|jgi:histidinol-phosphate aminotransferase|uniref:Histidinol-phosphate aminotransferase n=1 Tax=Lysinibacillus fusiformis TaxID=28031 RepID=A0A2I0V3K1_9BACI|nr:MULTISPECIES: histidinol-phosphate transaminase [Lysinibacillus]KUF33169.1 histidinol-phosphate aminotransferase [Lysinibacillus sp. F5]PKU52884.1 histidinol-phosphate transaminase [Lysinibacillus fusiformis]WCH49163.1 histidinol-phosphate transaminase [Lysinibacillus sp. OF-1]SCY62886.1 histidinol-phosphate aminotransferase [Lysinibacillus sp. SG9]SDB25848.1 histidinol-phosphate aminotransferase [Lysinibacillus sp. TC-37]